MTDVVSRLYEQKPSVRSRREAAAQRGAASRLAALFVDTNAQADELAHLAAWMFGAPGVGLLGWLLFGFWVGLALFSSVLIVALLAARKMTGGHERRVVAALPDLVDGIGRGLRSGGSLALALREAAQTSQAPLGAELQHMVEELDGGRSVATALAEWATAAASSEVRIVASALAIASHNEAGATRALDGVSQSLRDRQALDAEIRALTAHASASLQALVFLPIVFLGVDALFDGRALAYLMHHPFGRLCLIFGIGLEVVGWWWMRMMIRARMPR